MALRSLEIYAAVAFVVLLGLVIVLSIAAMAIKLQEDAAKHQPTPDPAQLQRLHARHDAIDRIAWIVAYLTAAAFIFTLVARVLSAS
jgi:hypothetical protein